MNRKQSSIKAALTISLALGFFLANATAAESNHLSRRQIKALTASAASPQDHLALARYYEQKAGALDAEATGYERAAQAYRKGPLPRNLMSPTTPGRYEYYATVLRESASVNRRAAVSHMRMANEVRR